MQHITELTFLITVFYGIVRSHPDGRHAGLNLFATACANVHRHLQHQVGLALANPPAADWAACFFTRHAQMREALSRSLELSALLMSASEAAVFRAQVNNAQDLTVIHYASDTTSKQVRSCAQRRPRALSSHSLPVLRNGRTC